MTDPSSADYPLTPTPLTILPTTLRTTPKDYPN